MKDKIYSPSPSSSSLLLCFNLTSGRKALVVGGNKSTIYMGNKKASLLHCESFILMNDKVQFITLARINK